MLFNSCMAKSETERRYEFVSGGAQNARWLRKLAKGVCGNYLVHSAGKALVALGTRLQQRRQLGSAHS